MFLMLLCFVVVVVVVVFQEYGLKIILLLCLVLFVFTPDHYVFPALTLPWRYFYDHTYFGTALRNSIIFYSEHLVTTS